MKKAKEQINSTPKKDPTPREAGDWFRGKTTSPYWHRRKLQRNTERKRGRPEIGKMYFFYYSPKLKKTLPIYDRYPLVLPIEHYTDGFLGLNLHYLSPANRKLLLNKLKAYANNDRFNENTKLLLSYELLKNTSTMPLVAPCIKRYLFSHMRSMFTEIIPEEWDYAIALPVEIFVTKS